MWVGGRVQRDTAAAARRRRGERVERASCAAEPKDGAQPGASGSSPSSTRSAQDGEVCVEEEQDLVFREPSARAPTRARPRRRARRRRGSRRASPTRCCCSGSRRSPSTRTASTTTTRTRPRSRATPTSSCTDRSPRPCSASWRGVGATGRSARSIPRPCAAVRQPDASGSPAPQRRRRRPRRGARRRPDRDDAHRDAPARANRRQEPDGEGRLLTPVASWWRPRVGDFGHKNRRDA